MKVAKIISNVSALYLQKSWVNELGLQHGFGSSSFICDGSADTENTKMSEITNMYILNLKCGLDCITLSNGLLNIF